MVNDFGKAIAAFVAVPETRQIAQLNNLIGLPKAFSSIKRVALNRKIGLRLSSLFL